MVTHELKFVFQQQRFFQSRIEAAEKSIQYTLNLCNLIARSPKINDLQIFDNDSLSSIKSLIERLIYLAA